MSGGPGLARTQRHPRAREMGEMLRGHGPCGILAPRLDILSNSLPNATTGEDHPVVQKMVPSEEPIRYCTNSGAVLLLLCN